MQDRQEHGTRNTEHLGVLHPRMFCHRLPILKVVFRMVMSTLKQQHQSKSSKNPK